VKPAIQLAREWVRDYGPRDRIVVVHDASWTDLVESYGFTAKPILAAKLDADPEVSRALTRIDYLVVPEWYYLADDAKTRYPTLVEARNNALPLASYGDGNNRVVIYWVSVGWQPTPHE